MTQDSIAWAAGLFEGEGCISSAPTPNPARRQPQLACGSVDFDIPRRFLQVVGCGNLHVSPPSGGRKQTQLVWYCSSKFGVEKVLKMFLPFFGKRRKARARQILKLCAYTYRKKKIR